jgi:hypothetical protein
MSPSELTGTITPEVAGPLASTFKLEVFGRAPSPDQVVRNPGTEAVAVILIAIATTESSLGMSARPTIGTTVVVSGAYGPEATPSLSIPEPSRESSSRVGVTVTKAEAFETGPSSAATTTAPAWAKERSGLNGDANVTATAVAAPNFAARRRPL